MHIQIMDRLNEQWVQAAIHFPFRDTPSACKVEWCRDFDPLIRACDSLPHCHYTYRITLADYAVLERTLLFTVPIEYAFNLRRYLDSFEFTATISNGSIELPRSQKEHQELLTPFPPKYLRIDLQGFTARNARFVCDYRVFPFLDDLLSQSIALGYGWTYQIHISPSSISRDVVRCARKNLLDIEALSGVSNDLIFHQRKCVERLSRASWACDEFLGVDNVQAGKWLCSFLKRRFTESYVPLKFPTPSFVFDDKYYDVCSGTLQAGFDISLQPWDKLCATAIDDKALFGILTWRPANRAETELRTSQHCGQESINHPIGTVHSRSNTEVISRYDFAEAINGPVKVFISYSHEDGELKDQLVKHLATLHRQGLISCWHDRKITGGKEWIGEIDENLNAADIVLLLISSDFVASDYCFDVEMKLALNRHKTGEARVIPILLRSVDWSGCPFETLQALPSDGRAVTSWSDRDQALESITKSIRTVVQKLLAK